MKSQTDTFVTKSIKKMFQIAGHDYHEKIFKQPDWYQRYTWSPEQEEKFKKWFIPVAAKELHISKKYAEGEYAYFNLMWGFSSEKPCDGKCKCECKGK
jgi:hypothetical protein